MKYPMKIAAVTVGLLLIAGCGADAGSAEVLETRPAGQDGTKLKAKTPKIAASAGTIAKTESFDPCVYSAAEMGQATGLKLKEGKSEKSQWLEYGAASCNYEDTDGHPAAAVNITWLDPQYLEASIASMSAFDAGSMEKIPSDTDRAYMQYQPGMNSAALHYVRKNLMIEVRSMKWKGDRPDIKGKMLSLRRVP